MPESAPRTSFDDFFGMLGKFKKLSLWAIGVGVAIPFVANFAAISPPWPDGVELMTAVVEILALVLVFHFLYRASRRRATLVLTTSAVMLIFFAVIYIFMSSLFTYEAGQSNEREIRGFICLPHIEDAYPDQCPFVPKSTLEGVGYDPEKIWTPLSIFLSRAIVTITWMASFVFLSFTFGSFVVYQSGQKARKQY